MTKLEKRGLHLQHSTNGSIEEYNLLASILGQVLGFFFASAFTRNLRYYKWSLHSMGRREGSDIAVKMAAFQYF